ncbi:MAG: hypothetical protein JWR54_3952 [Mucilaginibacter sp.]|nr:hypothetical protein [Mucilaginibacter sp.]
MDCLMDVCAKREQFDTVLKPICNGKGGLILNALIDGEVTFSPNPPDPPADVNVLIRHQIIDNQYIKNDT